MSQATQDNEINQVDDCPPLFTVRDTFIGLAACLAVGLLASVTLSAIILLLSASAQAEDNMPVYSEQAVYLEDNTTGSGLDLVSLDNTDKPNIIDYSTPETMISQKCDAHAGQLKNINIGDKLVFQNEGNIQQLFRITGIQVIEEQPKILPVVEQSSMLTMITCYPIDIKKLDLAVSYLVMIQEITPYQGQFEEDFHQGTLQVSHNKQFFLKK